MACLRSGRVLFSLTWVWRDTVILAYPDRVTAFQRRDVADKIAKEMTDQGHKVISLHGAYDAVERDNVMDAFRSGKAKVLITTNVLARGIDILMVNRIGRENERQRS